LKTILLLLVLSVFVYSQKAGYAESDHPVHRFLERMQIIGLIKDLDINHLPYSYKTIVEKLNSLIAKKHELNNSDYYLLQEFLSEFSFALNNKTNEYDSFYEEISFEELISERDKYLYFSADSTGSGVFINFLWNSRYIMEKSSISESVKNVTTLKWGGKISGSYRDSFGFSIKATNGTSFGAKDVLLNDPAYLTNYKFTESSQTNAGNNYFDETEGYAAYFSGNISLKVGRDKNQIGYGKQKIILSQNSLPMDYFSFNFNYDLFSFSYMHGKLLGNVSGSADSVEGGMTNVSEKYFVYHRFGLNISEYFNFGMGEMIIYSRRGLDLSYLNPFNFYKSIEHDNRDRDNSMLFFDLKSDLNPGLSVYAELLIDDIDFSKIGTGWYGNKTLLNIGIDYTPFYKTLPFDLSLQMIKIEPYVYSHRISDNNYSNLGLNLAYPLQPNSINYSFNMYYPLTGRLDIEAGYLYTIHGTNIYDADGNITVNVGGDYLYGHRVGDSENVKFLEGTKSYSHKIMLKTEYQLIRNYYISVIINFQKVKRESTVNDLVLSTLSLSVKL
jgi:hypothetical protein